jgi:hypothetical protein
MKYIYKNVFSRFLTFALASAGLVFGIQRAEAASAGDYRSAATGNWNATATWQRYDGSSWVAATATPTSSDGVITLVAGYTVTVATGVTVDQVVVEASGILTISSGVTLTLNDGTGTDLAVAGTLNNAGTISRSGSASISFTGTYYHQQNGGAIPTATWSTGSTCYITGITTTAPSGLSQTFYNLVWSCGSQAATITLGGQPTYVSNNFSVTSTGSDSLVYSSTANDSLYIGAQLYLEGCHFILSSSTGSPRIRAGSLDIEDSGLLTMSRNSSANPKLYISGSATIWKFASGIWAVNGGQGSLVFDGTGYQYVGTRSMLYGLINIEINNSTKPVYLSSTLSTNGNLIIHNGILNLAGNSLTLGPASTLTSPGWSASRMIVAMSGSLCKKFSSTGSFTFPVGDTASTVEYSPVTLTVNSGISPIPKYLGVKVTNSKHASNACTTDYLSRYWTVTSDTTGYNFNFSGTYLTADITGVEHNIGLFRYASSAWTKVGTSDPANNILSGSAITTVGDFSGNAYTQYKSNGTGGGTWSNTSTWLMSADAGSTWVSATSVPGTDGGPITVQNSDVITVNALTNAGHVTVSSGGKITVSGGPFQINNVVPDGVDLSISTSGTLECTGSYVSNLSGATVEFLASSTYTHSVNGLYLPVATWASSSTCNVTGITTSAPGNVGQTFGNLTWACSGQSSDINLAGNLTTVAGAFTLTTTNSYFLVLASTQSITTTVNTFSLGSGGKFMLNNGAGSSSLVVNGDFQTSSGSTFRFTNVDGANPKLYLRKTGVPAWMYGNFDCTAPGTGTGTIVFDGTATQYIVHTGSMSGSVNLTLNNSSNLYLSNDLTVTGNITLQAGSIILQSSNLTLSPTSQILGSPFSASKMIVASSTGAVRKQFTSTGSFTYPVGDNSGTTEYSPITVTITSGTFNTGAYFSIRVDDNYPSHGTIIPPDRITRGWYASSSSITSCIYNFSATYLSADVTGIESFITTMGYYGQWGTFNPPDTVNNILSGTAVPYGLEITGADYPRFKSVASGNWSTSGTWNVSYDAGSNYSSTSTIPSYLDGIISVQDSYTVTVSSSVSADQLTVASNSKISISAGQTLTIMDGSGTDLSVSGIVDNYGTLALSGTGSPAILFGPSMSGTYNHLRDGGAIPAATWNTYTTCNITGITSTAPTGINQSFGSLNWNCTGQTADVCLAGESFSTVYQFLVTNTNGHFLSLASTQSPTITLGEFRFTGGKLALNTGSGSTAMYLSGWSETSAGTTLRFTTTDGSHPSVHFLASASIPWEGAIDETAASTGDGTFVFESNPCLSITGTISGTIHTIINTPGSVTLCSNYQVTGNLTLTRGRIRLGSGALVLNSTSQILGSPFTVSNMIIPDGGTIQKMLTGTGSFLFPVGDSTGTPDYSPITLNFTSGTFSSNAYVNVQMMPSTAPYASTAANYLANRYWQIASNAISNYACNVDAVYIDADIVGTESLMALSRYYHGWNTVGVDVPASNTLSGTGITSVDGIYTGRDPVMFRSSANGSWTTASTWEVSSDGGSNWNSADDYPTWYAAGIDIRHQVTANKDLTIDQTTISQPDGLLVIDRPLTVNDGSGVDLTANDQITIGSCGSLIRSGSADLQMNARYLHYRNGGTIPTASWNTGSLCEILNVKDSIPSGLNQEFYDFRYSSSSQTANLSLGGYPRHILHNCEVAMTGPMTSPYLLTWASSGSITLQVDGNMDLDYGRLILNGGTGTVLATIAGSYLQYSGSATIPCEVRLTNATGGTTTLDVQGDFELQADASITAPAGSGTIQFSEDLAQSMSCSGTIDDMVGLRINKSANDVTLTTDVEVPGVIALNAGNIILGTHTLTLGVNGSFSGSPYSVSNMVVMNDAGVVRKRIAFDGSTTFPIGETVHNTTDLSPVVLNFSGGSYSDAWVTVHVTDTTHPALVNPQNYLTRYWTVTDTGMTGFSCNAEFLYPVSDVVGDEAGIECSSYEAPNWHHVGFADANLHKLTATGITSFSDFAGRDRITRYRTKADGNWTNTAIWEVSVDSGGTWSAATLYPTYLDRQITISHAVTDSIALAIDETTIASGGRLTVQDNTLTIANGSSTDLVNNGTVRISDGGSIVNASGATVEMNNKYMHVRNGGSVPVATWNTGSLCEIISVTDQKPGNLDQVFHDFEWATYDQVATICLEGKPSHITGDFFISMSETMPDADTLVFTRAAGDSMTVDGTLTVSAGVFVLNDGEFTLPAAVGGNLVQPDNSGTFASTLVMTTQPTASTTLSVGGNVGLEPNSDLINISGSATLKLNGTAIQTLIMNNTNTGYVNLEVDKATGTVALADNLVLPYDLSLTNGLLSIGNYNLTIQPNRQILGSAFGISTMIIAGTGEVRKQLTSGDSFTFPVGDTLGTNEYSPVTLTLSGGTYNPGGYVSVKAVDATHPQISGDIDYLTRYWICNASGISGYTASAVCTYPVTSVTGIESYLHAARWTGSAWELTGNVDTVNNELVYAGLTSLGDFTAKDGAAMFRTTSDGNWFTASNWEMSYNGGSSWIAATSYPDSNAAAINVDKLMTVGSNLTIPATTIASGGRITVTGATVTVADRTGTDVTVDGVLEVATSGAIAFSGAATMVVDSGATYVHARDGGTIPTAAWSNKSTCDITGVTSTLPSNIGQSYGDFRWEPTGQLDTLYLDGDVTVNGGLVVTGGVLGIGGNHRITYAGSAACDLSSSTLIGGPLSDMTIGGAGSGPSTYVTLPSIELRKLEVTRTAGAVLTGTITIDDTLYAASSCNLYIGSSHLNINGVLNACGGVLHGDSTAYLTLTGTMPAQLPHVDLRSLTVSNSGGVTLCGAVYIDSSLALNSGQVTLDANNLTLAPAAVVSGTPSASAMIVTNGSGALRRELTATGTLTFPVGDATGSADYAPVSMNVTSGTFAPGAYIGIRAIGTAHPGVSSNYNYLRRYWSVDTSGTSGLTANGVFSYNSSDVSGIEGFIKPGQWLGGSWLMGGTADTSAHTLAISGTTFSGDVTAKDDTLMYRSAGNGSWTSASTWEISYDGGRTWVAASAYPTAADGSIEISHVVTLTTNIEIDQTTIVSSPTSILEVDSTTLTLLDGPGTDLTVMYGGRIVVGSGGAIVKADSSASIAVLGTYWHDRNGGAIPVITFDPLSEFVVSNVTDTAPAGLNQTFGDLSWMNSTQTTPLSIDDAVVLGLLDISDGTIAIGAHTLTLNGDLSISGTGELIGGPTSNITIGGAGDTLALPAFELNNLNVTRPNGAALTGALQIDGTLTLASGATLAIGANTLTINGALDACSGIMLGGASSRLALQGSGAMVNVPGVELGVMTLNRASGAALCGNITIDTSIVMSSGRLSLGAYNLTINSSAILSITPDTSTMFVATGAGELRKGLTGTGSYTFPIGDVDGMVEYTPLALNFTTGSFGSGAYAGVRLANAKHPSNLSVNQYLNRYWSVSGNGITGFTCDVTGQYMPADVAGIESGVYTGKWNGSTWSIFGQVDSVNHRIIASGVTSFSDFTGGSALMMNSKLAVRIKAFLQGPFDGISSMNTYLIPDTSDSTTVMLPLMHPYGAGYNGRVTHMGTENVPSLDWFNRHPNIVDWIMVELRINDSITQRTRAAFLLNDGSIVDIDGESPVVFDSVSTGGYFIVVRHRNHLAIQSADIVSCSATTSVYDFTSSLLKYYGNDAKALNGTGLYGMYAGDGTGDGGIDVTDRITVWLPENGSAGYLYSDFNLDGGTDVTDRVEYWLPNNGSSTSVPELFIP